MVYATEIKLSREIYNRFYQALSRISKPEYCDKAEGVFAYNNVRLILTQVQKPLVQIIHKTEDLTGILKKLIKDTGVNLLETEAI